MAAIPEPENTIANAIDRAHERTQERPRPHLGGSMLGHHCDRWLWLSFRWAVIEKFNGRILRLFRRGHNEEFSVIADLKAAMVDVIEPPTGTQFRVDFGWHVSGSLDGKINRGLPESPEKRHILEIKTHAKKSFDDLLKKGVEQSKPMHFIQMQVYMHGIGIDRALYYAVCKDDDRLYTERVRYDKEVAEKYIARGHRIVQSERMPEPCSADPTWYQCKFCPAHSFCHDAQPIKEANCRTCAHSTPIWSEGNGSQWHCARWSDIIPTEHQYKGCRDHVIHPDLVPWQMTETDDEWRVVYVVDGVDIENGKDALFSSAEILANTKECMAEHDATMKIRAEFEGSIIG